MQGSAENYRQKPFSSNQTFCQAHRLEGYWVKVIKETEFWSFVTRKTYIDQSPKPQVGSNRLKCISEHILCTIQIHMWKLGRKAPTPPSPFEQETFFEGGCMHFMHFPASLVQVAEKPPPPLPPPTHTHITPPPEQGRNVWRWMYAFHAISSIFGSGGRKPFPPTHTPYPHQLAMQQNFCHTFRT